MFPGFPSIKDYVYIGAIAAAVLFFGWFTVHERDLGIKQQQAIDAREAQKERTRLQKVADTAASERDAKDKEFQAYMAAHPTGPIWLCQPTGKVPAGHPGGKSPDNQGPGPAPVPEVQRRDVSGNVDTVVRAAARLAELYREAQVIDPHK